MSAGGTAGFVQGDTPKTIISSQKKDHENYI
jgi:hypothetical protein